MLKALYTFLESIVKPKAPMQVVTTAELRKRDFSLYSNEAIDYALIESEKNLTESIVVFRKTNDISFIILSLYLAILGYGINKIITPTGVQSVNATVLIILLGTLAAMFVLWRNLWHGNMNVSGLMPDILIDEYWENSVPQASQIRLMKIHKLTFNQSAIWGNDEENLRRMINISRSIKVLLVTFILAGLEVFTSCLSHLYSLLVSQLGLWVHSSVCC